MKDRAERRDSICIAIDKYSKFIEHLNIDEQVLVVSICALIDGKTVTKLGEHCLPRIVRSVVFALQFTYDINSIDPEVIVDHAQALEQAYLLEKVKHRVSD